ncbi:MAG: hypothetical protein ACI4HL_01080 [Ruminococcus sp.]
MMKRILALLLTCVVFCTVLSGCGGDPLVGTWAKINNDGEVTDSKMYFNEDGTCSDIHTHGNTGAYPVSYRIQDDGTLIFTMEWDGTKNFDEAENEEQALDDSDYYYLSGDTLIFNKKTYEKQ